MRIGKYEAHRSNQWCYQLYEVMPEGYEGKVKLRVADDGRILRSIECYPNTIAACVRRMYELNVRDGIDMCADIERAVERVEEVGRMVDRAAMHAKAVELS